MKKNKIIFVACDTSNINQVKKILKDTLNKNLKIIPKFGYQLFYSKNGRRFLDKFKGTYFLDLKIMDVANTAVSAIDSIKDLKGCEYTTVHAHGGFKWWGRLCKKQRRLIKSSKC